MRVALALAAAALALVPAGAGAEQSTAAKPRLRLVQSAVLAVRGTHFVAGEHVRVTVTAGSKLTRRVTANGDGGFVARFRTSFDRCDAGFLISAVGDRGSRARLKVPERMCPPRL